MHLEETYAPREENWFDKEREKGMRQRLAIRMPFQDTIRTIRNAKDRAGSVPITEQSTDDMTMQPLKYMSEANEIVAPTRLWTGAEVLATPSPTPREPGVYGWYFKSIPPGVPTDGCIRRDGLTLLYAGISPKAPPKNGRPPSKQRLHGRIRYHYRGNAEGSTLRLTLGVLLSNQLGIALRRVGSGKRMTFLHEGEKRLSQWMGDNARVTWVIHPEPWVLEAKTIRNLSLPLNLDQNEGHAFHPVLSSMRKAAKANAKTKPTVVEPRVR